MGFSLRVSIRLADETLSGTRAELLCICLSMLDIDRVAKHAGRQLVYLPPIRHSPLSAICRYQVH